MDDTTQISRQRLEMLLEAMEMLEDLRFHMGMFQNQRYGKLKGRVTLHTRQTEVVKLTNDQI